MRRLWGAFAVAAALTLTMVGLPTQAQAFPPPPAPALPAANSNGITVTQWTNSNLLSDRKMFDATMTTSAIMTPRGGTPTIDPVKVPVKVRIWLPDDYVSDPAKAYQVLYLLHGGAGDFEQWSKSDAGDILDTIDRRTFKGIVVMPEGGKSGWYTDWAGHTRGNFAPMWETFHMRQLVPWIDANFNTVANRSGRAVAGLSMGGLGALRYAADFREQFSAVGAFSGGTTLGDDGAMNRVADSMLGYGAATSWNGLIDPNYRVYGSAWERAEAVYGPRANWAAVTPVGMAQAGKYSGYAGKFAMYAGGADAQGHPSGQGESDIKAWNDQLRAAIGTSFTPRYCTGPGEHTFDYWRNDLRDFVQYVYGGTPPAHCTENGRSGNTGNIPWVAG
ncbi:alpha/beta hydrolase [Embleya sp. NPDC127516]|uniref:alpha/beta hydrolase n=1 Tax=Embleya sp. NPDC127516 TaxID=3363990 RepID=UPI003805034C